MKKIVLFGALLFATTTVKAQGFYTDLNFGYGVCIPTSVLGADIYKDLDNPENSYEKNIYGSLGRGFNVTLSPGYMITKNIGVELGINGFFGTETLMEQKKTTDENLYDITKAKSNQLRIIPSVVLNTGGDKLYGYAKAGIVLPVAGSTKAHRSTSFTVLIPGNLTPDVYSNEFNATVKGSFSLGFRGALGIGYNFTQNIGLNFELYSTNLQIKAKNRKVIETAKKNGVEVETDTPLYYTETNYVNEVNSSSNNDAYNTDFDQDRPKQERATKTNFNQFGFSIGLRFKI
ncbi:MAG: outer membrane beta-barrel protein [Crocinitomicaceae bacterium]|nr:outer membrane beta-barrel protein [Crocinitomicaceae bacterium]